MPLRCGHWLGGYRATGPVRIVQMNYQSAALPRLKTAQGGLMKAARHNFFRFSNA